VTRKHKFDERGEQAIQRLKQDPSFDEPLYRRLGPVTYWTHVRAREAAEKIARNARETPARPALPLEERLPLRERCSVYMRHPNEQCLGANGHAPVTDPHGKVWDHYTRVNGNDAFWRQVPKAESDAFFGRDKPVHPAKPPRKHDKAAVITTRIVVVGVAIGVFLVTVTVAAMICVGLWNVFIA
jgi:hypothetical protein